MTQVPAKYKDIPGVFSYTIKGREMWFKPAGSGPAILLQKYRAQMVSVARDKGEESLEYRQLVMSITTKTLNVINNQFLDADDRDWVEDLILAETVEIKDVIPILGGGKVSQAEEDDKEVEVKPRKANPAKKATKAAPVMKTANAKRTRA